MTGPTQPATYSAPGQPVQTAQRGVPPAPPPSQPQHAPGSHAVPAPGRRASRSLLGGGTPAVLQLLLIGLVAASLVWGVIATLTVAQHASAASNVGNTSEPLSLAAQRMYQLLSDADVTATAVILVGKPESLPTRLCFESDVAMAGGYLATLRGTGGAGSAQFTAELTAISTGLPLYSEYVTEARKWSTSGQLNAAGSLMQDASDVMHVTLLPAASAIYAQESAALTAASAQATGLPWIVVTVLIAIGIGFTLLRAQRWLRRRTHRLVNYGLLLASAAVAVSTVWLVAAFLFARSDFQQGIGHGSTPAEELAQSVIAAQQARDDQILNLISRTGSKSFSPDFLAEEARIGPRSSGSLLALAKAASPAGVGAAQAAAAEQAATAWYAVSARVFQLDALHQYEAERGLVIGMSAGSSGAGFTNLVNDLRGGIAADQAVFSVIAAKGSGAFGGLEAVVIVAALLMAVGSAWGVSRRLAEYR